MVPKKLSFPQIWISTHLLCKFCQQCLDATFIQHQRHLTIVLLDHFLLICFLFLHFFFFSILEHIYFLLLGCLILLLYAHLFIHNNKVVFLVNGFFFFKGKELLHGHLGQQMISDQVFVNSSRLQERNMQIKYDLIFPH